MNYGLCVILSKYRLCQGIALYNSLKRTMSNFTMFILCTDKETYNILKVLNNSWMVLIKMDDVENKKLLGVKKDRTLDEYCWTLKPVFLRYVLSSYPQIDAVVHVDADLYFYSDPAPIFDEHKYGSVLVTTHLTQEDSNINSGFVSFLRNDTGLVCLKWWEEECLKWCYHEKVGEKFGDQGYLNIMFKIFDDVHIINTPGVNIAPWNYFKFNYSIRNSVYYVNDDKLIFYHFCGFRIINKKQYALLYGVNQVPQLFEAYMDEIKRSITSINSIDPHFWDRLNDIKYENYEYTKILNF